MAPLGSILAGCTQSTTWAKLYLHDILEQAHKDYFPAQIETWVDDLHQSSTGTRTVVARSMVGASVFLRDRLQALGCSFAPKSFVVATSQAMAAEISQLLQTEDVVLRVPTSGKDLGLDTTMGRFRRRGTVKNRTEKAMQRMVKS